MRPFFGFINPELENQRAKEQVYEISQRVTDFFWDDAPNKFGFEEREGQSEMAFEILDAIKNRRHLVVEAGVGIGKSFAYLVPLLYYNRISEKPLVVATSTIALQEQLYDDVERLKDLLKISPSVCLFKGQTHYICKQRAYDYLQKSSDDFRKELEQEIRDGVFDRRAFSVEIPQSTWEQINVFRYSKRTCYRCSHRNECGYHQMRENLKYSNGFILCNQDILTAHLKKTEYGGEGLLPYDIDTIVIDEAHNLESKVRSATTVILSQRTILLTAEAAMKSIRGLGTGYIDGEFREAKKRLHVLYAELTRQMNQQIESADQDMKYAERFFLNFDKNVLDMMERASVGLARLASSIDLQQGINYRQTSNDTAPDDLLSLSEAFEELMRDIDEQLIWLERSGKIADLVFCPKNTRGIIRKLYFGGKAKTILTSATLTNASDGDLTDQYSYFIQNTGFPADDAGDLCEPKPSPFPYDEHAMIYYCNDLPHPTNNREAFLNLGVERLVQLLEISHGKALVLFTAKTDMEEVFSRLQKLGLPYKVLMQQSGASQDRVLQEFKNNVDSVLLGSGTYWEGISIEGKSLSHLVVFRLPFPTPDPIIDYKSSIADDALMQVLVPEMIIKLKQGIGRLIRNFSDKGIVSIIDSRLKEQHPTKYHDITWNSLPIKNRTDDISKVREFYNSLNIVNEN